jgi:hypothetical protein
LHFSGIRHPQTQSNVERFHHSLKHQINRWSKPATLADSARALEAFREEYNQVRPHEALGMEVPAQKYHNSPQAYQSHPREWIYEEGKVVKHLNPQGCLDYEQRRYFVCEALAQERVCVDRIGDMLLVRYRQTYIREIDVLSGRTTAVVLPDLSPQV